MQNAGGDAMLGMNARWDWFFFCALTFWVNSANAQITPDSTLPNNSSVKLDGNTRVIEGGTRAGGNLFHSFKEFSVPTGSKAYFNNASDIQNIISRITGGSVSSIDGLIGASGTANLFLINPNGIIFGKNASLDVKGSFVGTTANALSLANGEIFSANPVEPLPTQLLNVNPNAFLFNQIANQSINSIQVNKASLSVPNSKSLLLVGGNVRLDNGQLQAKGGRIELGGLAGQGRIWFNTSNNLSLSFPQEVVQANVFLTNKALVNVAASGGGSITIHARNIDISENSTLAAGIEKGLGSIGSVAGDITLNAIEKITIKGSSIDNQVKNQGVGSAGNIILLSNDSIALVDNTINSVVSSQGMGNGGNITIQARSISLTDTRNQRGTTRIFTYVESGGLGNGGNIAINAESLSVSKKARIAASTNGKGNAGNIFIKVDGPIELLEGDILSDSESQANGNGGNITIKTGSLLLNGEPGNAARVRTNVERQGNAGKILVQANDSVTLVNGGTITSNIENNAIGNSGGIVIEARSLSMNNGGRVQALTRGTGKAGNIQVNAKDSVVISGNSDYTTSSGLYTSTEFGAAGEAGNINVKTGELRISGNAVLNARSRSNYRGGNITLEADTLSLTGGGQLLTTAFGSGDAGDITINATEGVTISGTDPSYFTRQVKLANQRRNSDDLVANDTPASGLLARTLGAGNGGNLKITTGELIVKDGAIITSQSTGQGNAGKISIATHGLEVTGGGQILTTTTSSGSAGETVVNAKDTITVSGSDLNYRSRLAEANQLVQQGIFPTIDRIITNVGSNSGLLGQTQGSGSAGNLTLQAGRLTIADNAKLSASTSETSTGIGGTIKLNVGQLNLKDGAEITVSNEGTGNAGNLEISARSIKLDNQATITAKTRSGNGGNITLQDLNLLLMRRSSEISTTAGNIQNAGDGGNITINAPNGFIVSVALENNDITANAFNGNGGRVTINAANIFGLVPRSREDLVSQILPNNPSQLDPRQLLTSDITAISQTSPSLNGQVNINTPDVDPNRGLVELPVNLIDLSQQIASGCNTGGKQRRSSFTATGRGGISPSPTEPLMDDAVVASWVTIPVEVKKQQTTGQNSTQANSFHPPTQIVEASGWVVDANGDIVLVASVPTVAPRSPLFTPASCPAS